MSSKWHMATGSGDSDCRSGMGPGPGHLLNSLEESPCGAGMGTAVTMSPGSVLEHCFPHLSCGAVYFPSCPLTPVLGSEAGVPASPTVFSSQKLPNLCRLCPTSTFVVHPQTSFLPNFSKTWDQAYALSTPFMEVLVSTEVPTLCFSGFFSTSSTLSFSLTHLCSTPTPKAAPTPGLAAETYYLKALHLLNHQGSHHLLQSPLPSSQLAPQAPLCTHPDFTKTFKPWVLPLSLHPSTPSFFHSPLYLAQLHNNTLSLVNAFNSQLLYLLVTPI